MIKFDKSYIDSDVYDDIMSGMNMITGDEFRTIMCTISQLCSDIVVKTLGPYGSTTLLDDGQGFIYPTKDGWSALKKIKLNNPTYNTVLNTLRKTSFSAVTGVGDGTTTAMVAANAFLQLVIGSKFMEQLNFNQALFRKMVETAADDVINELSRRATPITHDENGIKVIRRIAMIATNGNEHFANLIAEAYAKTENPDIHVKIGSEAETTLEIQEGYRTECYPLLFDVFVNTDDKKCIEKNIKVMIFNHNVTYTNDWNFLENVIKYCNKNSTRLAILAPYFDDMITNWYSRNVQKTQQMGTIPLIMLCQIPATTNLQRMAIEDLEILTNASVVDADKIAMFENLVEYQKDPEHGKGDIRIVKMAQELYDYPMQIIETSIGTAGKFEFSAKEAFLMDYEPYANMERLKKAQKDAKKAWEDVRKKFNRVSGGNLNKEYMDAHQRYIRLVGKMGSINVGGVTDLQKICDKDAVDDACLACRSAWDAGYICGMGLDTMRAVKYLIENFLEMLKIRHVKENKPESIGEKYYHFALECIGNSFMQVAQNVLRNKCSDDTRQEVVFYDGSIAMLTNEKILDLLVDGYTTWYREPDDRLTVSSVDAEIASDEDLSKAIYIKAPISGEMRYTYDIREGSFNSFSSDQAIINSVNMDTEIIRSMVSVLTTVITSAQFLSTGKMFDKKLTKAQQAAEKWETSFKDGDAFMNGILNAINNPENKEKVQTLREVLTGEYWVELGMTELPNAEDFSELKPCTNFTQTFGEVAEQNVNMDSTKSWGDIAKGDTTTETTEET